MAAPNCNHTCVISAYPTTQNPTWADWYPMCSCGSNNSMLIIKYYAPDDADRMFERCADCGCLGPPQKVRYFTNMGDEL